MSNKRSYAQTELRGSNRNTSKSIDFNKKKRYKVVC